MAELNEEQEEAASFLEGICAVIAVPGSGKTRTMMERIGKLVKDHGIAPESVLGLTFTRNAAEEMRSRLIPVLGDQASRVMLSTLHSFCYWVLKSEGRVFEILSGKDQLIFMRNILKQLRIKNVSLGMALGEISLAKNNLITVDEFRDLYEGDKIGSRISDIYETYDLQKTKKMLLDFDDLLFEVYKLFSSHPAIKDIAVLYRANFQSRTIEEVFSRLKIPYHIENGVGFYRRSEVKVLLDYLRLIVNPDSEQGDEALMTVINVPNRYVSRQFSSDLEEFAQKRGIHLYDALKSMPIDVPYLRKFMKEFKKLLDPLIEDSQNQNPADLISLLRGALDYGRWISDEDIPSPDDVKIQNIDQLQLSASRYKDIQSFLEYTDSFEQETSNDKEGTALMTVHKSKGLEFPVVFVIGLLEGICPSKKGDIEEERRIAFVACSRAMKHLYLSYSLNYLGVPAKKSIFIDEAMGTK